MKTGEQQVEFVEVMVLVKLQFRGMRRKKRIEAERAEQRKHARAGSKRSEASAERALTRGDSAGTAY